MKKIHKHLIAIAATLVILLGGAVLFNYVTDPYDYFDWPIKRRPGDLKNKGYIVKAVKIIKQHPDKLILGSSTVENGYALPTSMNTFDGDVSKEDTTHLQEKIKDYAPIFNGGVNGGSISMIYKYIQHAYQNNPQLKRVVIGLEWHMFTNEIPPDNESDIDIINKTVLPPKFYIEYLFSYYTLKDSYRTLALRVKLLHNIARICDRFPGYINQVENKLAGLFQPKHELIATTAGAANKVNLSADPVPDYYHDEPLIYYKHKYDMTALLTSVHYIGFVYRDAREKGEDAVLNPKAFAYLQKIVDFAREKNIKLDVYITPQHATHWITAERFGMGQYVDKWLRKIAMITPYWDFSQQIDLNDNVGLYFGGDDRHFNHKAGEFMLSAIMSENHDPKTGGGYVTKNTVDDYIKSRHRLEAQWLQHNKYFAEIFNSPAFIKMRDHESSLATLATQYQPTYHQYHVFNFLGEFIAIPDQGKPYDLRRVILSDYAGMVHGKTLDEVMRKIDELS